MKLKVKYSPPASSHVFSIFSVEETKTPAISSAERCVLHVTSTCYEPKVPSFASNHEQSQQSSKLCILKHGNLVLYILSCELNTVSYKVKQSSTENKLEMIEISSITKVSLVQVSSCSNTRSIRDDPYWTSKENSLELIELSSINKVSLV